MPPCGGGEEQEGVGEGRKSAEDVSLTFHRYFFLNFPQIHPIHVRRQHGVGLTQLDRSILHVKLVV